VKYCSDTQDKEEGPCNNYTNTRQTIRLKKLQAVIFSHSLIQEYINSVWYRSIHTKQVDVSLNKTVRLVTGCPKLTSIQKVDYLADIPSSKFCQESTVQKQ
ncbi:hypothetical protein L345_00719, partial [Ophiophagus hannah]